MNLGTQIAKQFREVHLDGKWVAATNLKDQLSDLTWKQATTKVDSLNTIAALAFHINYYVAGLVNVFEGGPLNIRDKYSYDLPPIKSKEDWEKLLNKMWSDAEKFANLVEQMPDEKLSKGFVDIKYGNYYRNIHSIIEHTYYHLGQIVMLKKLILLREKNSD